MYQIKEFIRVDVFLRSLASGINISIPILFFYIADSSQYVEFLQSLAIVRILSAILTGQQEHTTFSHTQLNNKFPVYIATLIFILFISVLVLINFVEDSNLFLLVLSGFLVYSNAIIFGFINAKYQKKITASIILKISLVRCFGYIFTFILLSDSLAAIFFGELFVLIFVSWKVFPIPFVLAKSSNFVFFKSIVFGGANGLRILRDNMAIILVTTVNTGTDPESLARISLSVTIFNALLTLQSIFCQSSWSELSSLGHPIANRKFHSIRMIMTCIFILVLGLQYFIYFSADFVFQSWFPFCIAYYFLLFLTGPKFFLSKQHGWLALEVLEMALAGLAIIALLTLGSTVESLSIFFSIVALPHIFGYFYVSRKFYTAVS